MVSNGAKSNLRGSLVRVAAISAMILVIAAAWVVWPAVSFLYRERTLAEAVRKYSETSGILMTADDDVRGYLVKLARHYKLQLTEGDVEIDYQDAPEDFGVPTRIGYTLFAKVDLHGFRAIPLVAQRSFVVTAKKAAD
ncbi:hypothetical protein EBR21_13400 [bacterium]|nr:hypothetical protein [bacterium]